MVICGPRGGGSETRELEIERSPPRLSAILSEASGGLWRIISKSKAIHKLAAFLRGRDAESPPMIGSKWGDVMVLAVAISFVVFLFCPSTALLAEPPEVMHFEAVPPMKPIEAFGNAWSIYASGVIDKAAAQRLSKLINANNIPNDSLIYFNSPGGNLLTGMELGRLIRGHKFRSFVGAQGDKIESELTEKVPGWGGSYYKEAPGACVSACALAFLGGSFRYVSSAQGGSGQYGVHRFFAAADHALDSDDAQIISAAIVQYIRDMGIDERLFAEMTRAGRDEMNYLPDSLLVSLGVVNNGIGKTVWTIETAGDAGMYLKGWRDTVFGEQKMLFICANGNDAKLFTTAIFDPKGNASQITAMSAISLELSGTEIRLPGNRVAEKPTSNHGWINMMVALDDRLVRQLMTARTVGMFAQFSFEAPVFYGIEGMDFTDGAKKLPAFLKSCH